VPSLELRRRTDLFWCYKIVFGLANVRSDEFLVLSPYTLTRGHKYNAQAIYRVFQKNGPPGLF